MENILKWLQENSIWFFSGVGSVLIGFILKFFRRKKKTSGGDIITTHGTQSPGKVEGDYNAQTKG